MSKFTNRGYDQCAVGAQDNSFAVSATGGAGGFSLTLLHDGANIIYITGIIITSNNPAANQSGLVTLAGIVQNSGGSGTLSFVLFESATTGGQLDLSIVDPIPSKDANTDVVLTVPAIASGASSVAVTLLGYRRPE